MNTTSTKKSAADDEEILPIHDWIYHTVFWMYSVFFRIGGMKVHGIENVPLEGPLILASNHASLFDPPLLGVTTPRLITTMGKMELFEKKTFGLPILGFIIQHMGTFPVRRGAPDRRALRRAIQVVKDGGALVIFPEGTRTPDGKLGEPGRGLAMVAHATKAPIVPVYLQGTENSLSKRRRVVRLIRTAVWFGEPLYFEEEYAGRGNRATMHAISDRVMREIGILRAKAQRTSGR